MVCSFPSPKGNLVSKAGLQRVIVHVGDLLRFHLRLVVLVEVRDIFLLGCELCHGNAINASVEQTNTGLGGTTRMGRIFLYIVAISHVYNRNKRHIDLGVETKKEVK